jgi:hypothetical protein
MLSFRSSRRVTKLGSLAIAVSTAAAAVLTFSTRDVPAQSAPSEASGCAAWDVIYSAAGSLQLSDTPMGAGNGVYPVGPGKIVLRLDPRGGRAALLSFEMPERFGIEAKRLFWTTHVDTNATARAIPDGPGACGRVAEGALQGRSLAWATKANGFHTDGTLACNGSLCGRFGAPPPGTSSLHIGPSDVQLAPFEFSADGKTFTMAYTFVSKTEDPRQTARLALSAREVSRSCAPVEACR